MSSEIEKVKVLVIEVVSKDVKLSATRWAMRHIHFQTQDHLMLLGVINEINNPMGYRSKVDSSSIFGVNEKVVAEMIASKKEVYLKNREIIRFSHACKTRKVDFHIDVQAGASAKEVAVQAALTFRATWVILDKHMMKEQAYIKEQLACRISAIKDNNTINDLQQPKPVGPQIKHRTTNTDRVGGLSEEFQKHTCSVCKNRRPKIGWSRKFTLSELQISTEGFSLKNFISENGFCSLYRGVLNGLNVAVHRIKSASLEGEEELMCRLTELTRARHENLVSLLGVCSEGSHRLLVYEYFCNGSVKQHLSENHHRTLSWDKRMKIVIGAARGLMYLHQNKIIHGNLRLSNVFITHDYEPLLGDFGLPLTEHSDSDCSSETRFGNLAYLTPEYVESGKISAKTDCYCFGVVLLQLITGLRTTDPILGGKSLVVWARPLLKDKNYPSLLDRRTGDSYNVHQLFWMIRIAEKCLCKNPRNRMTMDKVVYTLRCVMTASTVPVIRTFSPALSASPGSSIMESSGSASDDRSSSTQDRTPSVHSMGKVTGRLHLSTVIQEASSSASVPRRKAFDRKSTLAGRRDR